MEQDDAATMARVADGDEAAMDGVGVSFADIEDGVVVTQVGATPAAIAALQAKAAGCAKDAHAGCAKKAETAAHEGCAKSTAAPTKDGCCAKKTQAAKVADKSTT